MSIYKNLVVDQGQTFTYTISVENADGTPKDLTNYTIASQMRKTYFSSTAIDFDTAKVDLTGAVTISLTAAVSSEIKQGRYVYDVEITSGDEVLRVQEGIIIVTPQVTRAAE